MVQGWGKGWGEGWVVQGENVDRTLLVVCNIARYWVISLFNFFPLF